MPRGSLKRLWARTRRRPLVWDTITTTGWSSAGKAVGFVLPFFIAAWYGVTSETDAFFFAYGMILFLTGLLAPVVQAVVVPFISEARTGDHDVGKLVGEVLGATGVGLLALGGAVLVVLRAVLSAITQFDAHTVALVNRLLLETAPLVILSAWAGVLGGALNAYKRFAFPAVSPVFRAVVSLSVMFLLKDRYGIHAIAWGYVAGEVVRLAALLAFARGLRLFKVSVSLRMDDRLREFLKTASYQTVGMLAVGLNPVIDRAMASWLREGTVSILHYADRLYMVAVVLMTSGLRVTLLSHWSGRYYKSACRDRLKSDVKTAAKATALIALACVLVLMLLRSRLVTLALGRGAFDFDRLDQVAHVWACYLVGLLPYAVGRVFVGGHLTVKNTKVLMHCGFYMVGLKVLLNYTLMGPLDVAGIALATSLVSVFNVLYLGGSFFKKVREDV